MRKKEQTLEEEIKKYYDIYTGETENYSEEESIATKGIFNLSIEQLETVIKESEIQEVIEGSKKALEIHNKANENIKERLEKIAEETGARLVEEKNWNKIKPDENTTYIIYNMGKQIQYINNRATKETKVKRNAQTILDREHALIKRSTLSEQPIVSIERMYIDETEIDYIIDAIKCIQEEKKEQKKTPEEKAKLIQKEKGREIKTKIEYLKETIENLKTSIEESTKRMEENKEELKEIKKNNKLKDKIEKELEQIKKFKRIEKAWVVKDGIIAKTKPIKVKHEEVEFLLGEYLIKIHDDERTPKIKNIKNTATMEGAIEHPYVNNNACWGEVSDDIIRMARDKDKIEQLNLTLNLLSSFDSEGPYRQIEEWKAL